MQQDIDDVYNEVSAIPKLVFFHLLELNQVPFGVVSSSLVPDKDSKYDLGSSGKEWNDLFIDGTANIDSLAWELLLMLSKMKIICQVIVTHFLQLNNP